MGTRYGTGRVARVNARPGAYLARDAKAQARKRRAGNRFARQRSWSRAGGLVETDSGAYSLRVAYADEIAPGAVKHAGWYADECQSDVVRGVVVSLPHGRFLAGYEMSDCDASAVDTTDVYDDRRDAALAADEAARIAADKEMDYRARWSARVNAENDFDFHRSAARDAIADLNHATGSAAERIRSIAAEHYSAARVALSTIREYSDAA